MRGDQVVQDITVGIFDDGPHGDSQVERFPVFTVFHIATTRFAVGGFPMWLMVEVQQGGDVWVGNNNDVATVTAVAAIGATERFELFAKHGGLPVTTVASGGMHGHMINEL